MGWIVTDRDSFAGVADGATTSITPIKSSDGALGNASLHGFQISVSASDGAGHSATVKVYRDPTGAYLFHESEIDLSVDTQALVVLTTSGTRATASPPIFGTPSFSIKDTSGGGGKTYTILFLMKTLE